MDWHKSLQELRKELMVHEGYPCISLTMPTARSMPDNAQDPVRLKNLVNQAKSRLAEEIGKRPAAAAIKNLETAADSVDHNRNFEGLAIFANETIEVVLKTRFALPENLVIDDRFSLRAVLRAERRAEPYAVLVMSLEEARLYEAQREDLYELKSGGFPNQNASYGAGSKTPGGPGVNPTSAVDESRRRFVADCLDRVRAIEDLPKRIVAAGTPEILSNAQEAAGKDIEIIATLQGNYLKSKPSEIGTKAWEVVREVRRAKSVALVENLNNAKSANRYEAGVQSLVPLARDGRIELLVCGMDYAVAGRIDEETGALHLIDSPERWSDLDDVVDWIAHRVLETGGQVRFVEDDLMGETPIAAIVRY